MSFTINFTDDGAQAIRSLDHQTRERVHQKLQLIATCEYRHPRDWDYTKLNVQTEGRLKLSDSLRAFIDIDDQAHIIHVDFVGHRENLYI